MIAFVVSDMNTPGGASAVTRALRGVDPTAMVQIDLATRTVEVEHHRASARQLSEAISQAGYTPVAA